MDETGGLMSIGVFARRVGLAPSTLRFYDDCGLLPPARVDAATGYRSYAPEQEERAVLVRRLRDAGMPLPDASVVLDGPADRARAVLQRHADKTREAALAAQAVIGELLRGLPDGPEPVCARLGGPELAGAIRQVASAVARGATLGRFPVLGCVLLELDGHEVRLAATDRYRLSVRTLPAGSATGGPRQAAVPVEALQRAVPWLLPLPEVEIDLSGPDVHLHDGPRRFHLPVLAEPFPSYRLVLQDLSPARHRVITPREPLAALLARLRPGRPAGDDSGHGAVEDLPAGQPAPDVEPVLLHGGGESLLVSGPGLKETALPAVCTGPPARVHFDPRVLLPALETSVGPDVLLEISAPDRPVVVRSADQGSFTTLVMPVRA
ncbi:DNA polymerase III subunit beta family protein [Actinocorallia populi]|uniref:DNA polymerase III subunit beta family protein n=1 Tax=Actinocorallia populi TaxID=2079200 RepID=UPI000D08DFCA|nr:MerR family transcriptional regulator [Actinocorallia populi]